MQTLYKKTDEELFFEFLILKGLERIGRLNDIKYVARAKFEFDRMISKGYVKYFLIAWEYVNYCKTHNILVGTGRGSAAGSLISHCLGLTDADPIKYGLLFERYLSFSRRDSPDFDSDFSDIKREQIFKHLINRYGNTRYAQVATYSKFHPKGILRDIQRIFDLPFNEVKKISDLVLQRSGGDARFSMSARDTFEEFADAKKFQEKYPLPCDIVMKLEGHIRHKGVHAAAVILTNKDSCYYAPITKIGGEICYEIEKQECEDAHLVKFDILGLQTLSMLEDGYKSAGVSFPKDLEDAKVYDIVFKNGNTTGIFQFSSPGITKFISDLNVSSFLELCDANALYRPSCLHSGVAATYKNRKLGLEEVAPYHKSLEELTKKTQSLILYQEQVMMIMVKVAGLSFATAEMARKVITKSKGADAFNKMRQDFVIGAQKVSHMTKEEAERLFDVVSTFGSYGFNFSHAFSYSMLSYYCAWLKTYYPQHFYKACLKFEKEEKEIKNYIQDMKRIGLTVENPDINKSDFSYAIFDNKIYAGLNSIIGVGQKVAEKIIKNRPFVDFKDFKKRAKVSDRILKGLIVADAFREFKINKKSVYNNKEEPEDFTDIQLSQLIYKLTTLTPNINIKETYNFGNYNFIDISDLPNYEGGKQYFVRGICTDVLNKDKLLRAETRKHTHSFERHLIYLNLNDGTGNIACQINPEMYERFSSVIGNVKKQPVIVLGKSSKDGKKIYLDMVQIIGENKTADIDNVFDKLKYLDSGKAFILSSHPAVSKNGKSYYRVLLSNDIEGLCFRFKEKLFPGMLVEYNINQEPFIDIKVIEK